MVILAGQRVLAFIRTISFVPIMIPPRDSSRKELVEPPCLLLVRIHYSIPELNDLQHTSVHAALTGPGNLARGWKN